MNSVFKSGSENPADDITAITPAGLSRPATARKNLGPNAVGRINPRRTALRLKSALAVTDEAAYFSQLQRRAKGIVVNGGHLLYSPIDMHGSSASHDYPLAPLAGESETP